ncbi:putative DNA maturase B [Erwinia phage Loshitsa2]|uniref:DNA maturase B n=2 Tax=Micantvirus TaxID=3424950 RepID=A0AAE9FQ49_9CAUD|nr:putative DNA maturase B [Erwinia phage Micant]UNA01123.1 putative DNA maturase B [Erwinia phage Loshitsa2]
MELNPFVLNRLRLIAQQTNELNFNPRGIDQGKRLELSMMLAVTFKEFRDFAYVGMKFLGFDLTDMQADIADYMQYGPRKKMVAAQRGEAKSTLAALYSVWRLIQDQSTRVLIVSGGEQQASEVATLVIRLIETWPLLCWLKADPSRGDRTSYTAYDVHCDLKKLDKSPSVACVGVTASLQGKRADLLIPDDIETTKNGMTQTERAKLLTVSKDFAAICTHGDTLYLGTPQTKDSIYKTLPARGFEVRVWPGRVPSLEMQEKYGETLAPYILDLVERGYVRKGYGVDGTLGQSTDTGRYSEDDLIEKELDFGPEGFQLQYMLDTSLLDAMRTKIKLSDLFIYSGDHQTAPDRFMYAAERRNLVPEIESIRDAKMYYPAGSGTEMLQYKHKLMVVDPAGCGGDEISYAVGGAVSSYIHLFSTGGYQGGVSTENMDKVIDLCVEMDVGDILIESNMGHGTVEMLFANRLAERQITGIGVRGTYNSTQKERRIIDTISPVTRRHRFVVHERALEDDMTSCMAYSREKRFLYSAFQQLHNVTYDRGCLAKDDRADAIAMLVAELNAHLVEDESKAAEKAREGEVKEFLANPMGYNDNHHNRNGHKKSRAFRNTARKRGKR